MTSPTAKALDSTYNRMQWMGEEYLLEEVISAATDALSSLGEVFDQDVLYWFGYIYCYRHHHTGESSAQIIRQAPVKTMQRNYMIFHTFAPELAIEDLQEIHAQKSEARERLAKYNSGAYL